MSVFNLAQKRSFPPLCTGMGITKWGKSLFIHAHQKREKSTSKCKIRPAHPPTIYEQLLIQV
jgi:hypothetical protein